MTFLLVAGALALATALAVATPVLRARRGAGPSDRAGASLAIFRDQLAELGRDAERGLISQEEARAARTEIERRMIAAARGDAAGPGRSNRSGVIVAAAAIPVLAAGLYTLTGRPDVPSLPFAERGSERAASAEVAELTGELRRRLEADPSGGPTEGWVLLAQTHLRRGEYAQAVRAFEAVSDREGVPPGILTQHAEASIAASDGVVTPPALRLIDRALERDPTIPAGHYYRAQARAQAGDPEGGRAILLARMAKASGPEPWAETFLAEANRMGAEAGLEPVALSDAMPGVAAVEAMAPEERDAAIRGMVDGLAARLAEAPDDLEGWLRLGQARDVLGEPEAAREAYARALALMPEGDPRRADLEAALEPSEG